MSSHELQEFSDSLIATLRGIVLVLDTGGRITLVNPYFEELTGYAEDEILGRDWFDTFIPEDERDTIRKFFAVVLGERMNDGYTNAIMTKSGEQLLIEWHSKTLDDPDGRILGMLCTGYDVTGRVAAATQLKEAKDEAERSTATKSRFLAAASHDLRQPLHSLGLYLSVLKGKLDDSELQDIAGKMRHSLDAMGEILETLLDISKLEGGSIVPEKVDVNLRNLLNSVVTHNMQQAEDKGLKLESICEDCMVRTDAALLSRVIENFVTNAIRYTDRGRVTIECHCREGSVRIAVSDTGCGIDGESLDRIFDEYYQLENAARDRGKGLGLGLAIVRHIARLLEHPIDVSSVPGKGSTFFIDVPLGEANQVRTAEVAASSSSRASHAPVVLLVDDDPAIIDASRMLLESAGVRVHSASNGDDALALIESGVRPDVLVSDYRLPGMSGVELIRRMRNATKQDIRSVLMTGDTSSSEIAAANVENCTVLHKPFDSNQLLSLLGRQPGHPPSP